MRIGKRGLAIILVCGLAGSAALLASPDIKLRFLEVSREGAASSPTAVTSSYEKLDLRATRPLHYSLETEIGQIKKVFNIKDVKLITEADLQWPDRGDRVYHVIQFEGREYMILVTPSGQGAASKFRVEVFEKTAMDKGQTNLLDTEFQLPASETVVLGFEDTRKTAYFLYLTWPAGGVEGGVEGGIAGGVEGGVVGGVKGGIEGGLAGGIKGGVEGGVSGGVSGGVAGGVEGSVDASGMKPGPEPIKKVVPAYPEIARMAAVEGVVIVEAIIDKTGNVSDVKVLHSIPLLDQSACEAVKRWVYAPLLVKGKPREFKATITIKYKLNPKTKKGEVVTGAETAPASGEGPIRAVGPVNPPKLLKMVEPVYPEIAMQSKVEGVVICEATTDAAGRVVDVRILRSIPLLDQAAIDAVKQWVYAPMKINGKPVGVVFTVTARFSLDENKKKGRVAAIKVEDKEFAKGAVKIEGELKPPRMTKEVQPVYPEKARQADVEGMVILSVRTDTSGKVENVRILRSVPELDQAAIDAVKQWEYEPLMIKGKAVEAVFTVTVRFVLKEKSKSP